MRLLATRHSRNAFTIFLITHFIGIAFFVRKPMKNDEALLFSVHLVGVHFVYFVDHIFFPFFHEISHVLVENGTREKKRNVMLDCAFKFGRRVTRRKQKWSIFNWLVLYLKNARRLPFDHSCFLPVYHMRFVRIPVFFSCQFVFGTQPNI